MISSKEKELVRDTIELEGFDYCFRHYTDFPEIKDRKFRRLVKEYKEVAQALLDYVGFED